MNRSIALLAFCLTAWLTSPNAQASNCPSYPFPLSNGTTADANKVMADFNSILTCANTALANAPVNTNLTSITGLTTPLSAAQGGTGATSTAGFATSGANSNISSLLGLSTPLNITEGGTNATSQAGALSNILGGAPLSISNGGTGANNATAARGDLSAAQSGANSDITSLLGLSTPLSITEGGTNATSAAGALTALGAASASSFTTGQVLASPGSQPLSGGLIIKWGTVTSPTYTAFQTVTFSSAFPNGCFIVLAGNQNNPNSGAHVNVGTCSTTGFQVSTSGGTTNDTNASWIAIGN